MPNTTNFNFPTPSDTDLVKDGASAIRSLGNSIDTAFVDLKGGTTGQVLAKASNTDLDFTWATDASGIPATIFDAKGDLIAASAADTAARLAVGTNGQVLTADSTTATGLKWASPSSPSFVGCYLYKSANQSVNSGSYTALSWDLEQIDTNGFHSGSNTTIVVPSGYAGKYLLIGMVDFAANTTGIRQISFYRGGSIISYGQTTDAVSAGETKMTLAAMVEGSVGQDFELVAYHTRGSALNVLGGNGIAGSFFQAIYLGA